MIPAAPKPAVPKPPNALMYALATFVETYRVKSDFCNVALLAASTTLPISSITFAASTAAATTSTTVASAKARAWKPSKSSAPAAPAQIEVSKASATWAATLEITYSSKSHDAPFTTFAQAPTCNTDLYFTLGIIVTAPASKVDALSNAAPKILPLNSPA